MPPPNQPQPPSPAVALGLGMSGPNSVQKPGASGAPVSGAYSTSGPGILVYPPPGIPDYSEYPAESVCFPPHLLHLEVVNPATTAQSSDGQLCLCSAWPRKHADEREALL
ncbi:hypothetical protein FBUS_09852 [Fasciolopsis buskii]|uniref:Uncharacterized protein n=1 Tax=Fasciolopsis buskii TaxID=27845 RepID=A0A8E0S1U5_9TREM|nr:hypothetical protein FBUS_09852 [Fasciolopsis buski]